MTAVLGCRAEPQILQRLAWSLVASPFPFSTSGRRGRVWSSFFDVGGYNTISETMRLVQMVGTLRDLASLNQSPFETWVICHGLETAYTMRSWLAPFSNRCWHVGTAALQCANEICHPNYEEIGCIPTPVRGRCPISVVNFRQSTLTFCWP